MRTDDETEFIWLSFLGLQIKTHTNISTIFFQINTMMFLFELKQSQSKMISNDQELIQSDPTSCPQNQKGNNQIHKLTAVYERHSQ